jgi:hypothetical protein
MNSSTLHITDLSTIFPDSKGNPYFDHLACPVYDGVVGGVVLWGVFASVTLVRRPFGGKGPYLNIVPLVLSSLIESILSKMIDLIYLGTKKVLETKRFNSISNKMNSLSNKIDDLTYQRFKETNKEALKKLNNVVLAKTGYVHCENELFRRIFYQELFKQFQVFIVCQATSKITRKMGYSEKLSLISIAGDSIFYQVIVQVISLASGIFSTYQKLLNHHNAK